MTDFILIFLVAFIAATISGAAGFGGALLLLPILTGLVGIKAAVPILTIGQIFGNGSRIWFGRKELKWRPIVFFLITAIPFSIAGSYLFTHIDSNKIKIGIGALLILIVVYRRLRTRKITLGDKGMLIGGSLTGFLSGLAGSAGPLGAAFFLGLNLAASAYIASEAFTALIMHVTKAFVYKRFLFIGTRELLYGLFIGIAMIAGSFAGKKIIEKLSRDSFIVLVEILLLISGLQMIITGLR